MHILKPTLMKSYASLLDQGMRPEPGGTCYEYIAVYVDDLTIDAKDPRAFCNEHRKKYNLKLKGVGPDMFLTKIPIAPCYCQMMGRTLKEEIKITQYNNPTKTGKYSLEDLFRASDNIPHHYPKF